MSNNEFIYTYWSRTELGKAMIASGYVSESDLLFLMPNNIKKMHGLPLTRISGKQKHKRKKQRRNHILTFRLWDLIEETVEKTIGKYFTNANEHFNQFVDVKNVGAGDKV